MLTGMCEVAELLDSAPDLPVLTLEEVSSMGREEMRALCAQALRAHDWVVEAHTRTSEALAAHETWVREEFADGGPFVRQVLRELNQSDIATALYTGSGMAAEAGAALVVLSLLHAQGGISQRLPWSAHDRVVHEFGVRHGRADVVVFHFDGSATVIEVKYGRAGYRSVAAGIGQASLYAAQVAQGVRGMVVRRALAWTPLGREDENVAMREACELAGVVPIELRELCAYRQGIQDWIGEEADRRYLAARARVWAETPERDRELLRAAGLATAFEGGDGS